jgi:hypothetical protein
MLFTMMNLTGPIPGTTAAQAHPRFRHERLLRCVASDESRS